MKQRSFLIGIVLGLALSNLGWILSRSGFAVQASTAPLEDLQATLPTGANSPAFYWGNRTRPAAAWQNTKVNMQPVNSEEILLLLAELPLSTWNYSSENPVARHIGPVDSEFHAVFGLGYGNAPAAPADLSGVGLAAIQALAAKNDVLQQQVSNLTAQNADLQTQIAAINSKNMEMEATLAAWNTVATGGVTPEPSNVVPASTLFVLAGMIFLLAIFVAIIVFVILQI